MSQSSQSTPGSADDDFCDDDGGYCWNCGGEGFILVCCDDLCHGAGYCMHGDGEVTCPTCKGESSW